MKSSRKVDQSGIVAILFEAAGIIPCSCPLEVTMSFKISSYCTGCHTRLEILDLVQRAYDQGKRDAAVIPVLEL